MLQKKKKNQLLNSLNLKGSKTENKLTIIYNLLCIPYQKFFFHYLYLKKLKNLDNTILKLFRLM